MPREAVALDFRLLSTTTFEASHFAGHPLENYWYRPGDVEVAVEQRWCHDDADCTAAAWETHYYVLRPAPDGWRVDGWFLDGPGRN